MNLAARIYQLMIALIALQLVACTKQSESTQLPLLGLHCDCRVDNTAVPDSSLVSAMNQGLLASRFNSMDDLKSVINIEYFETGTAFDSIRHHHSKVRLTHCSKGRHVVSDLEPDIHQGDISEARNGDSWTRLGLLLRSPYAIRSRVDLQRIYLPARRRPDLFGESDPAFYDLALTAARNINTKDLAYKAPRDSSEKGYINSFNHIAAQAFITTCFSEGLADFVADIHERFAMPALLSGEFTDQQLQDLVNGPIDNYVDIINNEWGQELGKHLAAKYNIDRDTNWTPQLLADYINDLHHHYMWAFQIGIAPVTPEDAVVIHFAAKMNTVLKTMQMEMP